MSRRRLTKNKGTEPETIYIIKYAIIVFCLFIMIAIPKVFATEYEAKSVYCIYCGYVPYPHDCPHLKNNNTKDTNGDLYRWTPHDLERRRKRANAIALNKEGLKYWNKNWQEAVKYFRMALEQDPSDEIIKSNLRRAEGSMFNDIGIVYWKEGNWEKATEYFQKALEKKPSSDVIKDNLRRAKANLNDQKEYELLEERNRKALAEASTRINNILDLLIADFDDSGKSGVTGLEFDTQGSDGSSLDFMGLEKADSIPEIQFSSTVDLRFEGEDRALVVDPRVVKGQMTPEQAREVRERDAKAKAAVAIAHLAGRKGDIDTAIHYLKEARKAKPDDRDIQLLLGGAMHIKDKVEGNTVSNPKVEVLLDAMEHGKGDWEKSIDYLNEYRISKPDHLGARDALNFAAGLSKNYQVAKDAVNPLELLKSPVRDVKTKGLCDEAIEHVKQGNYEEAFNHLKKAHELNSADLPLRDAMNFAEGLWIAQNTQRLTLDNTFEPSPDDSKHLLPAVQNAGRMPWPGDKRKDNNSEP